MSLSNTKQGKILVVDDMHDYLGLIATVLKHAGFEVITAQDGWTAIQEARQQQPDLILLDVMMPDLNGFETCDHLKAHERTKDIPIIFLTALSDIKSKVRGFEIGGVDYVTKPINDRELIARVTAHLTVRRLQQTLQAEVKERRKIEAALRRYADQLQARNAELDAFSRTVAHNLKEPLSVIRLGAEAITIEHGHLSSQELRDDLAMLFQSADKACHIIDELLILATVHKEEVKASPVNMKHIVQEASERLSKVILEKKVKIVMPDEWPIARGYGPWIEEVWFNYLSNAIKYGGQPPLVTLGADLGNDGMINFWIKDNGIGVTPHQQAQLFTPFTRIHTAGVQGDGLGLSIVRHIIEKLGGKVGVQSEGIEGRGSLFSFTLPGL